MKKFIFNLLTGMSIIFLLWCAISYCEILLKHWDLNPNYNDKNIIVNVIEWADKYHNCEN